MLPAKNLMVRVFAHPVSLAAFAAPQVASGFKQSHSTWSFFQLEAPQKNIHQDSFATDEVLYCNVFPGSGVALLPVLSLATVALHSFARPNR